MTGTIVVGGWASKNGKTMRQGVTFVSPHLFRDKRAAAAWMARLKVQNPKTVFMGLQVSTDHLPKTPK